MLPRFGKRSGVTPTQISLKIYVDFIDLKQRVGEGHTLELFNNSGRSKQLVIVFRDWFPRIAQYVFEENVSEKRVSQKCPALEGVQKIVAYQISVDMVKQII